MKNLHKKTIVTLVVLLIIMLLSIFVLSKVTTTTTFHANTIASLDEKKATVLKLTAASTAAATAIAAVPGDATTPIANKLADLTSYFLIVLMVVFAEKYLVTLMGYATFMILIPLACLLFALGLLLNKTILKILAGKFAVFGLVIFIIIPASVKVSNAIDATYAASVEATINSAQDTTDQINDNTDEDGNIITKTLSKLTDGISGLVQKGEDLLNNFIESIAVMLVTSCVIPVALIFFAIWLTKMLFGVEINVPRDLPRKITKHKPAN